MLSSIFFKLMFLLVIFVKCFSPSIMGLYKPAVSFSKSISLLGIILSFDKDPFWWPPLKSWSLLFSVLDKLSYSSFIVLSFFYNFYTLNCLIYCFLLSLFFSPPSPHPSTCICSLLILFLCWFFSCKKLGVSVILEKEKFCFKFWPSFKIFLFSSFEFF